ncbi:hypothetical protein GGR57DRAFT_350736 [Xylariaceae sp. FL1272]|nr:hypothetical protein GGR57DRAFT_350736 [Xylariaceae sp. FL1272]
MSGFDRFPSFPRLPTEIRRLIWAYALPRGRIQLFARSVPWEDWRLFPPLISRVCHEARDVAKSLAVIRGFPTALDKHNETWFIGTKDVLELASGYPYPLSNPEPFFAAAEALAINSGDFEGDFRLLLRDLIEETKFRFVKVVYLIVDQVNTAYWPGFRPDVTHQDKGKGTILDLCDKADNESIENYLAWARSQEMSPLFTRLEDVQLSLRVSLNEAIVEELNRFCQQATIEHDDGHEETRARTSERELNRDHPWIQERCDRLPEFRPAILVLGWT